MAVALAVDFGKPLIGGKRFAGLLGSRCSLSDFTVARPVRGNEGVNLYVIDGKEEYKSESPEILTGQRLFGFDQPVLALFGLAAPGFGS